MNFSDIINLFSDLPSLNIVAPPPNGTPAEIAETGIEFFELWIRRIGGIVAFIGAIKLGISVHSEQAQDKFLAITTMISGFMVVSAVTNLDIFTAAGGAGAEAEFEAIMDFIAVWAGWLGAAGMAFGAVMLGFALKDFNAGGKVIAIRAFIAGAIILAVSQSLALFV
jgi:hypothetical protein